MRIIIITQDSPFYLAENLDYLLRHMPSYAEVVGCVVSDVSPFGKKEKMSEKALKTLRIFGGRFFLRYAVQYLSAQFNPRKKVLNVLDRYKIKRIHLQGSINSDESLSRLSACQPDLLISIAGNELFRKPLIELAPKGCLNLHTALLPRYRGLMPSFWVLKNGETETGVSVFFVDEGIDSGPILVQKRFEIGNRTLEELIQYSKRLGMDAILESIDRIYHDKIQLLENDDSQKEYNSFPERSDVREFLASGARFY